MAVTTGTSVNLLDGPSVPGQQVSRANNGYSGVFPVLPVLQREDGSFVGTVNLGNAQHPQYTMVVFDQGGDVLWTVQNDQPLMATAGGRVIGQSGITYDANGSATGQTAPFPTYSWNGNAYQQQGSVGQVSADLLFDLFDIASSFWPIAGGNYSDNETAYSLVRTFSDNEKTLDLVLTNASQTNPNQQTITNVFNDILAVLTGSYGGCSGWLTGTSSDSVLSTVNSLITFQAYGHGTLNDNLTAAFVGGYNLDRTAVGVPEGWSITVNDQGSFFNAQTPDKKNNFFVGPRAFTGGTLQAQAEILIHELAHLMNKVGGAAGFQPDAGNTTTGRSNDKLVNTNCGTLIKGLR